MNEILWGNMNIKFVVGGLMVIGGLVFFNNHHYKNKLEDNFRQDGQRLASGTTGSKHIEGYSVKTELLNKYPHYIVYMTVQRLTADTLPQKVEQRIKYMPCDMDLIKLGTNDEADIITARANVIEEDQIKWTYIVQNEQGSKLLEFSQVVKDCPEFQKFRKLY